MFLNKNRYKRLGWFGLILASAFLVVFAALKTFEENLVFFYTPSQIISGEAPKNRPIRVGGMVEKDSIARIRDSLDVTFNVIDAKIMSSR